MKFRAEHIAGVIAVALLIAGQTYGLTPCPDTVDPAPFSVPWDGLVCTPREAKMGHSVRILYVHVPTAWNSLIFYTLGFLASLIYLVSLKRPFDWASEAFVEVALVLNGLLLIQGSIWAKPTWDRWWIWEPRLTASAVMFLTFVGVWLLRAVLPQGSGRAIISSIVTVLAWVNIPITYLIVRVMPSMHQMQSNPLDLDTSLRWGWRINALGFGFLALWLAGRRYRIARARTERADPPPLPAAPQEATP